MASADSCLQAGSEVDYQRPICSRKTDKLTARELGHDQMGVQAWKKTAFPQGNLFLKLQDNMVFSP